MNNNEEIENLHINIGRKQLSEEEIKEVNDFVNSEQFKDMVREAKEQSKRVRESKITERTKI